MPLLLEDFGLDFFTDDENTFLGLMKLVAQDGKAITGYYGLPYLNLHLGAVQLIERIDRNEEGNYEAVGLDSHLSGNQIWTVRVHGASIDRKDGDPLQKRVLVSQPDGNGMAVVNLVNADVLPSYLEDDLITMQMIGLPRLIEYFEDEDAYADSLPPMESGKKLLLEDGSVFPTGFMRNRMVGSPEFESDENLDDLTNIRGTVKELYHGRFAFQGQEENLFIRCVIETQFGPLEIVHTYDQIAEAQRGSIRKGAIVNFYGILSGDVAINEYENGIVRDEEHNLAALRFAFVEGDPERLRSVLADNASYRAESDDLLFQGSDEIIKRIRYVQSCNQEEKDRYYAHMATIQSVDGKAAYAPGKRCVVLAHGKENAYESIAFIEVDEAGLIESIVTSTDARYHFVIDEKPDKRSVFDDIEPPSSVVAPMLARARWLGVLDDETTDEAVLSDTTYAYELENNVDQVMKSAPDGFGQDNDAGAENLFGYLFAKATELDVLFRHPEKRAQKNLMGSYSDADAWEGVVRSYLDSEAKAVLAAAFETGKQFYKDFHFFQMRQANDTFDENLRRALILVQILGVRYAKTKLK